MLCARWNLCFYAQKLHLGFEERHTGALWINLEHFVGEGGTFIMSSLNILCKMMAAACLTDGVVARTCQVPICARTPQMHCSCCPRGQFRIWEDGTYFELWKLQRYQIFTAPKREGEMARNVLAGLCFTNQLYACDSLFLIWILLIELQGDIDSFDFTANSSVFLCCTGCGNACITRQQKKKVLPVAAFLYCMLGLTLRENSSQFLPC